MLSQVQQELFPRTINVFTAIRASMVENDPQLGNIITTQEIGRGAGAMTQWLRALAALPDDLDLIPTRLLTTIYNSTSRGSDTLLGLWGTAYMWHSDTHSGKHLYT